MEIDFSRARNINSAEYLTPDRANFLVQHLGIPVLSYPRFDPWPKRDVERLAKWQGEQGLVADGILGKKTFKRMDEIIETESSAKFFAGAKQLPDDISEAIKLFPELTFGIDVSAWQPDVDWAEVKKAGVAFAFLRSSIGSTVDKKCAEHLWGARGNEIMSGIYHVGLLTDGDQPTNPRTAAENACRVAEKQNAMGADLGMVLDLEPKKRNPDHRYGMVKDLVALRGGSALAHWVGDWVEKWKELSGLYPIVYLNPSIARIGKGSLFVATEDCAIWIAKYSVDTRWPCHPPAAKESWPSCDIKQYRAGSKPEKKLNGGRCPGVMGGTKDCDCNFIWPGSPLEKKIRGFRLPPF